MSRPKFDRSGMSPPVRALVRLYEFLASLKLAVVLIFSLACVLALATFIEANLGTDAVQFYVYQSTGFAALLSLLAINIFCAASIRYPWKRHQTGFVITHIGLLTLLAGSALSYRGNVNSQMLVFKGDVSHVAIDHDEGYLTFGNLPGHPEPLRHRFRPGPFNWSDLAPYPVTRKLKSLVGADDASRPWQHPPETLYDAEGTKVEIVDFLSRSKLKQVPYLGLTFQQSVLGFEVPVDLEFDARNRMGHADFQGLGQLVLREADGDVDLDTFLATVPDREVDGEGAVVIRSRGETQQFSVAQLKIRRDQAAGPLDLGGGRSVELVRVAPWEDISAFMQQRRTALPDDIAPVPVLTLRIRDANGPQGGAAKESEFLVFGGRTSSAGEDELPDDLRIDYFHPEMPGRIDLLLGPAPKAPDAATASNADAVPARPIAYRVWQQKLKRVVATGRLEPGTAVDTWSMGGGDAVWRMRLETLVTPEDPRFTPPSRDERHAGFRVVPVPFSKETKDDEIQGIARRTKLRISGTDADGQPQVEEFWLRQRRPDPWPDFVTMVTRGTDHDLPPLFEAKIGDRAIAVTYDVKETDVGSEYKLVEFDLDVDPGTRTAANYTSHLVQIDVRNKPSILELKQAVKDAGDREAKQKAREKLQAERDRLTQQYVEKLKGVDLAGAERLVAADPALDLHVVTMNQPLDYPDLSGRTLRYFQENYYPPNTLRKELGSVFRVNWDPGRFVKQLGSFLIVLGIFTMFYMRAYFFKAIPRGTGTKSETAPPESILEVVGPSRPSKQPSSVAGN